MNRKSIIIALLMAVLLIIPVLAQAAPVAKFTSVEGDVDVTAPGQQAVPAHVGDPVNVGDIIRTKSKSKCEVTFLDGSVLRLAETSRLRVAEFSQQKEQRSATLNLFRGKIQNIVKTAAGAAGERSKYEVQMPTAVTGVRGTNFFAFFQAGVSGAVFKEGTGYGYSLNRPQEVRTIAVGQAMLVTSPDLPPAVRPASSLELNQHERDTTPSAKPKEEGKKEEEKKPETVKTAKAEEGKKEEGKKEEEQKAPAKEEKAAKTEPAETKVAEKAAELMPETKAPEPTAVETKVVEKAAELMPETKAPDPTPVVIAREEKPAISAPVLPTPAPAILAPKTVDLETFFTILGTTDAIKPPPPTSTIEIVPPPTATYVPPVQLDTIPPKLTLAKKPSVITASKSASFTVSADEPIKTYTYLLDGVPFTTANSTIDLTGLSEGLRTLEIVGDDLVGNRSAPITFSWTVEYPAPVGGGTSPPVLSEITVAAVMDPPTDQGITTGTMTVDAVIAAPEGLPAGASGGSTSGVVANNPYSGFFTLVSGSWEGLLSGIYVTGEGAGYIEGDLKGTDQVGSANLSGSGPVKRSSILGSTDISPLDLNKSLRRLGLLTDDGATGLPLPVLGSVSVGGAIGPSASAKGELKGLEVSHNGHIRRLGVWGITTSGGTYTNASFANTWNGIYGQEGTININGASTPYFMLGQVSGKDDQQGHVKISGNHLSYLDMGYIGDISLEYRGKYDPTKTIANYDSAGAGTFTLDPLSFGGMVNNGGFHSLQGNDFLQAGSLSGLWGGTDNLWNGNAREFLALGTYGGKPAGPALFTADVTGNANEISTLSASGFMGGAFADNTMTADFAGFYTRLLPDSSMSEAGFLVSDGSGSSLISGTDSGLWKVSGNISALRVEDFTAIVPRFPPTETVGQSFPTPLANEYPGGPDIRLGVEGLRHKSFTPTAPWGIWQMIKGGTYSGLIPSGTINTAWTIDEKSATTNDTLYQTTAATWDNTGKTIAGNTAFTVASWHEGKTMIGGGNIKGIFDPDAAAKTWQTVGTGGWLETPKFLEMQGGATGEGDANAVLKAFNIPSVLVGTANLSQVNPETSVNNLSYVTLNNVGFYALSTGGVPRIWTTDQVSGSYTASPTPEGPPVPLAGGGLNAYFGVRNWQNGFWGANIVGGGSLSGVSGNISFAGGAAGLFSDGFLSGMAAGTAISYPSSTDNAPPELGFLAKPALSTKSNRGDFTLSLETDAYYRYSLDGGSFQPLANISGNADLSFSGLSDGQHTLAVVGADAAGNLATASHTWTVEPADSISNNVALGDFMSGGYLFGRFDDMNNLWQLTLKGVTSAGLPPGPWLGTVSGMADTNAFSGFISGISGSWEGLMSSLYVNNTGGVGYFRGYLSGTDGVGSNSLSGTGQATMTAPLGLTQLTPDNFQQNLENWGTTGSTQFPLPNPQDITVGGAFTSPYEGTGNLLGITAADAVTGRERKLGVWQSTTHNGAYRNNTWTAVYTKDGPWEGIYGSGGYTYSPNLEGSTPYYMLGSIKGTDDGIGHTGLSGELTYLDTRYLGKIDLAYRGKYGAEGYESAGAGAITLEPLEFVGRTDGHSYRTDGSSYYYDGAALVANWTGPILFGGINSLWTSQTGNSPVPFTLLGGFSEVYSDTYRNTYLAGKTPSHIYYGEMSSYNASNGMDTTYDGGAFRGFLGVSHVPNNQEGALDGIANALYLDPDGNAGFLEGAFTGTAYVMPDAVSSGDNHLGKAAGSFRLTQMAAATGILPENLGDSLQRSWDEGKVALEGTFSGNTGTVKSETVHFETAALVNENNYLAQPWGIYAAKLGGTFEKPLGTSDGWTANMGGWADFGAYFDNNSFKLADSGYFLAQTAGLAGGGKITGDLQGRFITSTKIGEMTGQIVGTYSDPNHTSGPWQAASLGKWTGRDLKFMSQIDGVLTSGSYGAYRGDIGNTPINVKLTWFAAPQDLDANLFLPSEAGGYPINSVNLGDSASLPFAKLDQDVFAGYGPETITISQLLPGIYFYAVRNMSESPALRDSGAKVEVTDGSGHAYTYNVPLTGEGLWYNAFLLYKNKIFSIDTIGDGVGGGGMTDAAGSYSAFLGGDSSLWNAAAPIPFFALGKFSASDARKGYAFRNPIYSQNIKEGKNTTFDGGAYAGWMAGVMGDGVEGAIYAFHMEPAVDGQSNVGIITGGFSGETYPQIGMWAANGTFFPPLNLGTTSLLPEDLNYSILSSSVLYDGLGVLTDAAGSQVGKVATPPFSEINMHRLVSYQLEGMTDVLPQIGLWDTEIRASADALTSVPASLTMEITGADPTFDVLALVQAGLRPNNAANPSNYTLSEKVAGAWVNLSDTMGGAATGVLGGEVLGTFNPAALTFQAAALGAWVETGKFRELQSTEDGRTALAKLNIPAVLVGKADLTGSGTFADGTMSVMMRDMGFFAYSTGAPAQIWTTGPASSPGVGGSYTGAPAPGWTVPLAGENYTNASGLNADFVVKKWDGAAGSQWAAQVTGGGTVNANAITFKGGAAGVINSVPQTVLFDGPPTGPPTIPGTFTGTGAGIVKPAVAP